MQGSEAHQASLNELIANWDMLSASQRWRMFLSACWLVVVNKLQPPRKLN